MDLPPVIVKDGGFRIGRYRSATLRAAAGLYGCAFRSLSDSRREMNFDTVMACKTLLFVCISFGS
jgi:hypothetical protein